MVIHIQESSSSSVNPPPIIKTKCLRSFHNGPHMRLMAHHTTISTTTTTTKTTNTGSTHSDRTSSSEEQEECYFTNHTLEQKRLIVYRIEQDQYTTNNTNNTNSINNSNRNGDDSDHGDTMPVENYNHNNNNQNSCLVIDHVEHFAFISCSDSLINPSVILACCISSGCNNSESEDDDDDDDDDYCKIVFYKYRHSFNQGYEWKQLKISSMSFTRDMNRFLDTNQQVQQQELEAVSSSSSASSAGPAAPLAYTTLKNMNECKMKLNAASQCLLSATLDFFCLYVKNTQSIYVWSVHKSKYDENENDSDKNKDEDDSCIDVSLVMQLDIFASVYSICMSWTHIIVGKINSIQIYNWRALHKLNERKIQNSSSPKSGAKAQPSSLVGNRKPTTCVSGGHSSSSCSVVSSETNERMGRAIYLPKITKVTTREAKVNEAIAIQVPQSTASTKALEISSLTSQVNDPPSKLTSAVPSASKSSTKKRKSKKSSTAEESKSGDEVIKATISQQTNETIIEIEALSNSKILMLSNLGNFFALNCLMPFERDVLIQLNCHVQGIGSLASNGSSSRASGNSKPITMNHFCSYLDQSDLIDNNGTTAIVINESTIALTRMKNVFESMDQHSSENIELLPHTVIHHSEPIRALTFLTSDNLFLCSGDNNHMSMSLYNMQ